MKFVFFKNNKFRTLQNKAFKIEVLILISKVFFFIKIENFKNCVLKIKNEFISDYTLEGHCDDKTNDTSSIIFPNKADV